MMEASPKIEGFCASCERPLWLDFAAERLLVHAEVTGPAILACPDCASALESKSVLSGAELDRREIVRLMEAMTGEAHVPSSVAIEFRPCFQTPKGRATAAERAEAAPVAKGKPGRPLTVSREKIEALCGLMVGEGISPSLAAERVGVSRSTLSRWRQDDVTIEIKVREARLAAARRRVSKRRSSG